MLAPSGGEISSRSLVFAAMGSMASMTATPIYREFAPGSFLGGVVECFWTSSVQLSVGTAHEYRVLPDGCMDLLFDFQAGASQRALMIGTMSRAQIIEVTGGVDLLGVRFHPGGLGTLFAINAADLANAEASLGDFWGKVACELWEQLAEAGPEERVRRLQDALIVRMKGRPQIDPFLRHCVARIGTARGSLKVGDLERSTGLGLRQQ